MKNTESIKIHAKNQEEKVREVLETMVLSLASLDEVHADGHSTSEYIDYTSHDMMNAMQIFYHVASNYAIKHGFLDYDNVVEKMKNFQAMLKDTFGLDTTEEVKVDMAVQEMKKEMKYS